MRPLSRFLPAATALGILFCTCPHSAFAQGIYSCVDAKGRKITSDRPIAECADREQKELNASGTVKRTVGPTLSAQELAAVEERERAAAHERARDKEAKRRGHALLVRYPLRETHDAARAAAMKSLDSAIEGATARLSELIQEHDQIRARREAHKSASGKAPQLPPGQSEEIQRDIQAQKQIIFAQEEEKKRVASRFDEELKLLLPLWLAQASQPTPRR